MGPLRGKIGQANSNEIHRQRGEDVIQKIHQFTILLRVRMLHIFKTIYA